MAFVGRKAQLGQIRAAVNKGENILVMGKPGIGKTALLRAFARQSGSLFWREPNSLRPLLLRICKRLELKTRGLTVSELLDAIEQERGMPLVIIIDDLDSASKKAAKMLAELSSFGCIVIIGAAEAPLKGRLDWAFERRTSLGPLSRAEAKKLLGKDYNEAVYRDSKGFPLALLAGGWHPCVLSGRIDLLPVGLLAPVAYLLLSLRYAALLGDERGLYMMFGLVGFLLLSLNRGRRVWK